MSASSRTRTLLVVGLLAGAGASLSASAYAQAASPAAQAITKGQEAVSLFEQGKYGDALARFQEADALYHSPVFLLYVGRSQRGLGRWVDAIASLRRAADETVDAAAPALWKQAQTDARRELTALVADMPSVIVTVEGGSAEARVTIDGATVTTGQRIELDPGEHRIVAYDGDRIEANDVDVRARSERTVNIAFPPVVSPEPVRPPELLYNPPPQTPKSGLYLPGLVVAGVGGAALIGGAIAGVNALNRASSALPSSCEGTTCPSSRKDEVEGNLHSSRRLGTVADVLLIGGGAAVIVGVILMIIHPRAKPTLNAGLRF